jgi:hypothetical protein
MSFFALVVFVTFGILCLVQMNQADQIEVLLRRRHPAVLKQSKWRSRLPLLGAMRFARHRADKTLGDPELTKKVIRYRHTRVATIAVWLVWGYFVVMQFR